ncbi:MAG: class I SAM-dependent methyltransferase, partial [Akkermansiaceae bacterium]
MQNIYTNEDYLKTTKTWHSEDSPWKADQICEIIRRNKLSPRSIAEIGCGAGAILDELSKKPLLKGTNFYGYDISPQAIELCKKIESDRIHFECEDLLEQHDDSKIFDILLVIDVFEHVPDYLGF